MPCATTQVRMCAKEFRLGQVEHGKDASTSATPKGDLRLGCIRRSAAYLAPPHWHQISRHDFPLQKHQQPNPFHSSAAHALIQGSCRIPRESLLVPASFPHAHPAPSSFHSQDMVAPWASARLSARSHSDSNSQPLHIRRCLRRIRPQQKAFDRLGSPPSLAQQAWDERPWNMG